MWACAAFFQGIRRFFAYYSHMGGERGSTARQRLAGKICCNCKRLLDSLPWHGGERYCEKCAPRRRVYMKFLRTNGKWRVSFLEPNLTTSLPRQFTFADDHKIIEMAERGGAKLQLEDRQALEHGLLAGQGAAWLNLTPEQYAKLR